MTDLSSLGETIKMALPGAVTGSSVAFQQLTLTVDLSKIVAVAQFLRDDPGCRFVSFVDITAVDYPGRQNRFEVVYHLMSPVLNARIRFSSASMASSRSRFSIREVFRL